MTKKIGREPAFARQASTDEHDKPCNVYQDQTGLTKREYFAALAMQGIISSSTTTEEYTISAMARDSVRLADALCEALENNDG